ncbi:MAG: type II toxin-antitoxin system RelE/ParE family toxin [Alphaproteobacteria bacterium]|jgi:plasmid stabilization system protein ParE|nr:type II toxin-antitoxin system RelE/ParE family toxin [Alphaproteobacteria bacterium]
MPPVLFHPDARGDFDDIADYIARHDENRAIAFVLELQVACRRYADFPRSGRDCGHIFPGLRRFPHGNYVIYYRTMPADRGIEVLHIIHAARDHESIMRDGEPPARP